MRSESEAVKLLAVSWAMPPILSPRSIQVPRTLKALARLGWETTVLCADPIAARGYFTTDDTLAEIYDGTYSSVTVQPPAWLKLLLRSGPGHRLLVKSGLSEPAWKRWAIRTGLRLRRSGVFQALITYGQPWVDHLVGLELHRRISIPWVAHFSDPWADSPFLDPSDSRHELWREQEKVVIREADAVVFVTEETRDLVMRKYPSEWRNKSHVVAHGYDPDLLDALPAPSRNARLTMASTGTFYGRRAPVPLLKALVQLKNLDLLRGDLEVQLVGAQSDVFASRAREMGLAGVVAGRSQVPFLESLCIAGQADVLLLIDAPSEDVSVFLPSKLVDYLMLRKPVLGITPANGASARLLERLGCLVSSPDDIDGIARAIENVLSAWRSGRLCLSPEFSKVAREYDIRNTTRLLDDVISEAMGARSRDAV